MTINIEELRKDIETGAEGPYYDFLAREYIALREATDAILAKLDPDALIVAALEAAETWTQGATLIVPPESVGQRESTASIRDQIAFVIRALAADTEARAAIKAKAGWSE